MRTICAKEGMPATSTVYSWLREYSEFHDSHARAREIQADPLVDEMIEIADTESDPNRARVMIDAGKWLTGKLRPKKYGDRVELDHKMENSAGLNHGDDLLSPLWVALVMGKVDSGGKKRESRGDADPMTFEKVARERFDRFKENWTPTPVDRTMRCSERSVYSWIGARHRIES